ncbi:MAG TPA: circadian clock KaiB family protein [Trichocoleus sp.]
MSLFDRTPPTHNPKVGNQEALDYLAEHNLERYILRLYVAKNSLRSLRAIQRIQSLCEERLPGRYELEIVDIYEEPERLEQDQVFAVPTLIKQLPPPLQRLIGDMTDIEKLITCLDI